MGQSFSTNIGLSALPEYEQSKDPAAYAEFLRIRNALQVLQAAIDGLGGAGGAVVTHTGGNLIAGTVVIAANNAGDVTSLLDGAALANYVLSWVGIGSPPIWKAPSAASLPLITINTQTASYTLVAADCAPATPTLVRMNVAGANTLIFPLNATTAIAIGSVVGWMQYGAGTITLTPGTGAVNLRTSGSLTSRALYSSGTATKIATDEWLIEGDTT